MNYTETIQYIHGTKKFGSKLGLQNIKKLMELLGNPDKSFKSVHVAGTNGKGSVCAYIASILEKSGYKTGLYISPYLEKFEERIQINGKYIEEDDLARIATIVKEKAELMVQQGYNHPTEFEIVTAIGFYYFMEQKIDIAVVEVGLGGRLDSTNVIIPEVSVITTISYDHMDILGDTLAKIAYEKAGIIKEGRPVVMYPQVDEAKEVIQSISNERKCRLYNVEDVKTELVQNNINGQTFNFCYQDIKLDNLKIKMLGNYQIMNVSTAIMAVLVLRNLGYKIDENAVRDGLYSTKWPGRLEMLNRKPIVLLDGAHNEQGAESLYDAAKLYLNGIKITMVTGILKDKDFDTMVQYFSKIADRFILTTPDSPRALDPEQLSEKFKCYVKDGTKINVVPDIEQAVKKAVSIVNENEALIVSGSLYLVGKARTILRQLY